MYLTCLFDVSLLSNIIPRNLISVSIFSNFPLYFNGCLSLVLFFCVKIIPALLFVDNLKPDLLHQFCILSIIFCIILLSVFISRQLDYIALYSSYSVIFIFVIFLTY